MFLFQFCTYFEQPRGHHQENQLYQYNIWYMSLCVSDHFVCSSERTCTRNGHWHRVTYTRCCIDTIDSPDDDHEVARNTYRIGIKTYREELCFKLVIYQESEKDARSKNITFFLNLRYDYANFWKPNTDIGSARAHCWNNWINICPPNCLHWLWDRTGTLFGEYRISYFGNNAAEMWRWPYQLSVMSILKRNSAVTPFPICLHGMVFC